MNTLSKESFARILYVIQGQNYANIYARLILLLPKQDSSLFSKILLRNDGAEWVTDDDIRYKSFVEASPEEKELIAEFLEERKKSILSKLKDMPYALDLFQIPSQNQIFFTDNSNGGVSVVLAQWGFRNPAEKADVDIISALIAQPRVLVQSEVKVLIRYSDGLPANDANFNLDMFGSVTHISTNGDGIFNLGKLINGKQFSIKDDKGNAKSFTVAPNGIYEAEFPLYTDYSIVVKNQEGTPCPHFSLTVNDETLETDDAGQIAFENHLLQPNDSVVVLHEATSHKETYSLSRNAEENHFVFVYQEKFFSSLDVLVRYDDGEILPVFAIKAGNDNYETDEYGHLLLESLDADTTLRIVDGNDCNNFVDVQLQRGDNQVELIIPRPPVKMVRVRILDRKGNPVQNLPIKLTKGKKDAMVEFEGTTDADGYVSYPFESFDNGDKIKLSFAYNGKRMKVKQIK